MLLPVSNARKYPLSINVVIFKILGPYRAHRNLSPLVSYTLVPSRLRVGPGSALKVGSIFGSGPGTPSSNAWTACRVPSTLGVGKLMMSRYFGHVAYLGCWSRAENSEPWTGASYGSAYCIVGAKVSASPASDQKCRYAGRSHPIRKSPYIIRELSSQARRTSG